MMAMAAHRVSSKTCWFDCIFLQKQRRAPTSGATEELHLFECFYHIRNDKNDVFLLDMLGKQSLNICRVRHSGEGVRTSEQVETKEQIHSGFFSVLLLCVLDHISLTLLSNSYTSLHYKCSGKLIWNRSLCPQCKSICTVQVHQRLEVRTSEKASPSWWRLHVLTVLILADSISLTLKLSIHNNKTLVLAGTDEKYNHRCVGWNTWIYVLRKKYHAKMSFVMTNK